MKKIKVLNLYAGIGGNREDWDNSLIEVTAVEINEKIANKYKKLFPEDNVIIADAHEYLLKNYKEYDFIWSSPPCVTHSRINLSYKNNPKNKARFPDMKLWQEIIFLQHFCKCKWVVENVIPYYDIIFNPKIIGRHCFWSNFHIPAIEQKKGQYGSVNGKYKKNWSGKRKITQRNKVDSKLGKHIFDCAYGLEANPLKKYMNVEPIN